MHFCMVQGTPSTAPRFNHSPATSIGSLATAQAPALTGGPADGGPGTAGPGYPAGLGSGAPRGAPWGTVCLAVLVQRGSDKAAAVRAKVLHSLILLMYPGE